MTSPQPSRSATSLISRWYSTLRCKRFQRSSPMARMMACLAKTRTLSPHSFQLSHVPSPSRTRAAHRSYTSSARNSWLYSVGSPARDGSAWAKGGARSAMPAEAVTPSALGAVGPGSCRTDLWLRTLTERVRWILCIGGASRVPGLSPEAAPPPWRRTTRSVPPSSWWAQPSSALRPDGSAEGVTQGGAGIFRPVHRCRSDLRVRRCEKIADLIDRQLRARVRNPYTVVLELTQKHFRLETAHHCSPS